MSMELGICKGCRWCTHWHAISAFFQDWPAWRSLITTTSQNKESTQKGMVCDQIVRGRNAVWVIKLARGNQRELSSDVGVDVTEYNNFLFRQRQIDLHLLHSLTHWNGPRSSMSGGVNRILHDRISCDASGPWILRWFWQKNFSSRWLLKFISNWNKAFVLLERFCQYFLPHGALNHGLSDHLS